MKLKKAQEDLFSLIIGLVIVVAVVLVVFLRLQQEATSFRYEKTHSGNDISLFVNALYAAPNDVIVAYPQDTLGFTYEFKENELAVSGDGSTLNFIYNEEFNNEIDKKTIETSSQEVVLSEISDLYHQENTPIIFIKANSHIAPIKGVFIGDNK